MKIEVKYSDVRAGDITAMGTVERVKEWRSRSNHSWVTLYFVGGASKEKEADGLCNLERPE